MNALQIGLLGHYPPPYGGVATLLEQMQGSLNASGHDAIVYNLGHGQPVADRVVNLDRRSPVQLVASLERVFRTEPERIFHYVSASYRSFWLGAVVQALALVHRRSLVWSLVGGDFPRFLRTLSPLRRGVADWSLRRANAVIACNREIDEVIRQIVPDHKVHLLSNTFPLVTTGAGHLPPDVAEAASRFTPLPCTTASSSPEYALDSALEALAHLQEDHPNIGLVISLTTHGIRTDDEALEALIDRLGVRSRVHIGRALPNFLTLLERSDIFLRTPLVDGDSMSVREALALGTPTVASDTIFRPPGVSLFRKGDGLDLARAIRDVLADVGAPGARPTTQEAEDNLAKLETLYQAIVGT